MKLVVVRHGESEWNKENLFTGWADVELSDTGVKEAIHGGELLKDEGYDFDVVYTSYLKRAIHTNDYILTAMERTWLPVIKDWHLNERNYGALQGLNKAETAQQYGEEQVLIWRRSFDVLPPALSPEDPRAPRNMEAYRGVSDKTVLPLAESLKETIERVVPYFESEIKPRMLAGERVLIVAHGNSLRALVKYFDHLSDEDIMKINIPTGVPLVYEFNSDFSVKESYYLGDQAAIQAKMEAVANQGKTK